MKVGLIGCGRMGRALIMGAIDSHAVKARDVMAYDVIPKAVEALCKGSEILPAEDLSALLKDCDTILLCTKPGDAESVLSQIAKSKGDSQEPLLISVAAGVTIETLEKQSHNRARVIRSMPNTPALVGKGAAAYSLSTSAHKKDAEFAQKLLGSVGRAVELPEKLLDAVTGLSGSGPGYIYLVIEALADGGVLCGLPREQAIELAAQTVLGTAAMVQETGLHPAVLKDMVTSPGGTTITGLKELEAGGVRNALINAVKKATDHSMALGEHSK